jgi:mono/diheme cytochrome c family protein
MRNQGAGRRTAVAPNGVVASGRRSERLTCALQAAAIVLAVGCMGNFSAADEPVQAAEPAATAEAPVTEGAQLYARHCAGCHGEQGDGRGVAAVYLFPKPRDFQAGRFRLVSTENRVPARDDLEAVLVRGMPGSSMPPWAHFTPAQRAALIDEIMRLRREGARLLYAKRLQDDEGLSTEELAAEDVQEEINEYVEQFSTPGSTTEVPDFTTEDEQSIARGKEVYAKFGCLQCHGPDGKGDGVQQMADDEGYPTAPRDFTRGIFKGGHDPASLFRRIAYGMPGTPMPNAPQLTPQQMIDLVHYVRSLSTAEDREQAVANRETIVVHTVETVPREIHAADWDGIATVSLRMLPVWWRDANPDLRVQAVHDRQTIAVRVSWQDMSLDRHSAKAEAFEDAMAMELFGGDVEPFLGMGAADAPLDLWFWDADRQAPTDVEDHYPNVVVDIYPFSEPHVTTSEFAREGTRLQNQPPVSLPALALGNQLSPGAAANAASSLGAGGPGSVTFRLPRSQIVTANGSWRDGRWTVVLRRALKPTTTEDGVSLVPGGKASVAFAVWDGEKRERDGIKLITIWQDLKLEP